MLLPIWRNAHRALHRPIPVSTASTRQYAKTAPKVASIERQRRKKLHEAPKQNMARAKWPLHLLDEVSRADPKVFKAPANMSLLLDEFVLWYSQNKTKEEIRTFLKRHQTNGMTCLLIFRVLQKTGQTDPHHRAVARNLKLTIAKVEEEQLSIYLIESAFQSGAHPAQELRPALQHVTNMAESGNVHAMRLLAKIYEREGKLEDALRLAENSRIHSQEADEVNGILPKVNDTWSTIARLRARSNDPIGVQVAVETGALDDDEPAAYYELALKYHEPGQENYIKYMLKAAASGHLDAAAKVGQYYHYRAEKSSRALLNTRGSPAAVPSDVMEQYALAQLWLDFVLSQPSISGEEKRNLALVNLSCILGCKGLEACKHELIENWADDDWAHRTNAKLLESVNTNNPASEMLSREIRNEISKATTS